MGRRLDETLANAGIGSRADVRNKILSGRVCVNCIPVRKPDAQLFISLKLQPPLTSLRKYAYDAVSTSAEKVDTALSAVLTNGFSMNICVFCCSSLSSPS